MPILLCMLQKFIQKGNMSWDSKVGAEAENEFLRWFKDLSLLEKIIIPR